MLYHIQAKAIPAKLKNFGLALQDGTIRKQTPDGQEIVSSMKRAVVIGDEVHWYETCFCNPPLSHEKSTVYDRYFNDMEIESAESVSDLQGEKFWDILVAEANGQRPPQTAIGAGRVEHVPSTNRLI